jgi:uncharacterized protein YjbI with pentapeptide repeats
MKIKHNDIVYGQGLMPKPRKTIRRKNHIRKNKTKKQCGGNNDDFMNAINNANLEYVKQNIATINDLSFEDIYGKTPLEKAIIEYSIIEHPITNEETFSRDSNYVDFNRLLLENGASGENIELPNFNFENINLKNANLKNAYLYGSNMINANLEGARLQNADLSKVDLTNATLELTNLTNTKFTGANLENTNFDDAVIDGTIFTNTILGEYEDESDEDDEEYEYEDGEHVDENDSFLAILNNPDRNRNLTLTTDLSEEEFIPQSPEGTHLDDDVTIEFDSEDDATIDELDIEPINHDERLQALLHREKITLQKYEKNPFTDIELEHYDFINMEEVKYCDYIKDKDNLFFLFDKQVAFVNRTRIRNLTDHNDELFDENKIVYKCRGLDEAFVPRDENIISGPTLNMDSIGLFGVMIPLEYLDEIVNSTKQIFIIEPVDDIRITPIASLSTRMGGNVVSANHCQANVNIQMGKISYIENNVLLEECAKKGGKKTKTNRKKQTKAKRVRKTKKTLNK